jgi:hypothetical protein
MSLNLAARAGRWSAAHWKTATFGWIAFVLASIALGGVVGTKSLGDSEGIPGESGRMEKILDENFQRPGGETVLIQSGTLTAKGRSFEAAVDDVVGSPRSRPSPTSAARSNRRTTTRSPPTATRPSFNSTSGEIQTRQSTRSIR